MSLLNKFSLLNLEEINLNQILFSPIENYFRIKYTCFTLNCKYFVCGASSGGLYVFDCLNNFNYLFTIPNNNGKITCLQFSKINHDLLAFGTNRGTLKIIQLKISLDNLYDLDDNQPWQELYLVNSFTKYDIDLILFQDLENNDFQIFLTDSDNNVYIINKLKYFSSLIFKNDLPFLILKLENKIHQMEIDDDHNFLLISADDKSFIFDLSNLCIIQIGTKNRTNGIFGSCFFTDSYNENLNRKFIFSARPSLRLWQVNLNGNVVCTHQFKNYLIRSEPKHILYNQKECHNNLNFKLNDKLNGSNFNKLYKFNKKNVTYLLTYTNDPYPILFIINPLEANIIYWTFLDKSIKDILINNQYLIVCYDQYFNNDLQTINDENKQKQRKFYFSLFKLIDLEEFIFEINNLKSLSLNSFFNLIQENKNYFENKIKFDFKFKQLLVEKWNSIKIITNTESFKDLEELFIKNKNLEIDQNFQENLTETNLIKTNLVETNSDEKNKLIEMITSKHKWNSNIQKNIELDKNYLTSINEESQENYLRNNLNDLIEVLDKNSLTNFKCACGKVPYPRSHLFQNSTQKQIKIIVIKLLNQENFDEMIKISFDLSIWELYLDLLLLKQRYIDYIQICLSLMDLDLLKKPNFIDVLKQDVELSKHLFKMFIYQKNVNSLNSVAKCLVCENKFSKEYIKWQDVINFFYKNLNIKQFIETLQSRDQDLPKNFLSSKLCIHLLQTEAIKQYESSLTNDKLNKLKDHLNNRQLQLKCNRINQTKKDWSLYIDLNLEFCNICKLNLKNCKEFLVIFKCKHIYHKSCLNNNKISNLNCQYCFANNK